MQNRLTFRHDAEYLEANGMAEPCEPVNCVDEYDRVALNLLVDKLAAYEDTGLMPAQCTEYAKAEEEGRLVVPPCKVGDTVYLISRFNKSGQKHIAEHFIAAWKLHSAGHCIITTKGGHDRVPGTSAFTTKEAAQKALEGKG